MLTHLGYRILIEEDAGMHSRFPNSEYVVAGAEIFVLGSTGFPASTFIVRVLRPSKERELIEKKQVKVIVTMHCMVTLMKQKCVKTKNY
ncbi:hypothetical protein IZU94_15660 [Legionella sp. 27fs60]|uniref:Alanine dehydrogenase/pyridine nucleotide transhydrogenase N-terminal domain-containing protein n=1 Tax=Legionella bononiensis TaxID=2793102 RepID=A0ABS1WDK6_9GAMM|nr:hypothetical protein [Legionella bononiensis]MBL7527432.1 hypothetical protein [Legionella bononiensis]